MSKYSTGKIAKLCGVTVRTVQYYDKKGLLHPSGETEGGNRLYSDADLDELRFILLLKSLGLGLAQIKGVLESPNRMSVALFLLEVQREEIIEELGVLQGRLATLDAMRADIELTGALSIRTESDMVKHMQNRKSWRRWVVVMVAGGIAMDILWIGTLIYAIISGAWWVFVIGLLLAVLLGIVIVRHYWKHVTYICPACHSEFRPKVADWFFSRHSTKTRMQTCACCGTKDWCVERWHAQAVEQPAGTCVLQAGSPENSLFPS